MKKLLLLAMLSMITYVNSNAQFNRIINASIGDDYSRDIVSIGGGHSVILSSIAGSFTLKEIDGAGAVQWHYTYSSPATYACQLIQAQNGDYIVVGYVVGAVTNPFAARINSNGTTCYWFQEYLSNNSVMQFGTDSRDVNVVYAGDDPSRDDYILAATGDHFGTIYNQGYSVNAIRFDGTSGASIWNKKYQPDLMGGTQAPHMWTEALAWNGQQEGAEYFIAGSVNYYPGPQDGFNVGIDGAGDPTGSFIWFDIAGYGFGFDAIFDGSNYVMTYTFGNSGIGDFNTISNIAISTFAPFTRNANTQLYWESDLTANHTENYGYHIKQDANSNNYIVAAYNYNSNTNQVSTSALLKVDNSFNVQQFKRYNKRTYSIAYSIASVMDNGNEIYVLATNAMDASSNWNVRLIGTNTSGETCGSEDMAWGTQSYSHNHWSYMTQEDVLTPSEISGSASPYGGETDYDCDPTPPNDEYKRGTTRVNNLTTTGYKIYPNPATDQLNVDNATGSEYQVMNAIGQVIEKGAITNTKHSISLKMLASGVYTITLTHDGNSQKMKFVKE